MIIITILKSYIAHVSTKQGTQGAGTYNVVVVERQVIAVMNSETHCVALLYGFYTRCQGTNNSHSQEPLLFSISPLGSFTRVAWDQRLYVPSEGRRMTQVSRLGIQSCTVAIATNLDVVQCMCTLVAVIGQCTHRRTASAVLFKIMIKITQYTNSYENIATGYAFQMT